jgi:hypothetical protein
MQLVWSDVYAVHVTGPNHDWVTEEVVVAVTNSTPLIPSHSRRRHQNLHNVGFRRSKVVRAFWGVESILLLSWLIRLASLFSAVWGKF